MISEVGLKDVRAICQDCFPTRPEVIDSYEKVFASQVARVESFDPTPDITDFEWTKCLPKFQKQISTVNPRLLQLSNDFNQHHSVSRGGRVSKFLPGRLN